MKRDEGSVSTAGIEKELRHHRPQFEAGGVRETEPATAARQTETIEVVGPLVRLRQRRHGVAPRACVLRDSGGISPETVAGITSSCLRSPWEMLPRDTMSVDDHSVNRQRVGPHVCLCNRLRLLWNHHGIPGLGA